MKTLAAGPRGTFQVGREYDVPEGLAREYIAGGYAEAVKAAAAPPAAEFEREVEDEAAVQPEAPEAAVTRRGRARRPAAPRTEPEAEGDEDESQPGRVRRRTPARRGKGADSG